MHPVSALLRQPYPLESEPRQWLPIALLFGLFITGALALFAPFGLATADPLARRAIAVAYGTVTVVLILVYSLWKYRLLEKGYTHWTLGKEIAYRLCLFMSIVLGNQLMGVWLGHTTLTLEGLGWWTGVTFLVGMGPNTLLVYLNYWRMRQRNAREAAVIDELRHEPATVTAITAAPLPTASISLRLEGQESLTLAPADLLAAEAADNYVALHWLEKGQARKRLLRGTLTQLETLLAPYGSFYRCHRSFLVNLTHVQKVAGNAQGYVLTMGVPELEIPVARRQGKELSERLKQHRGH